MRWKICEDWEVLGEGIGMGVPISLALRLARYFGNSLRFWLGLQMDYDLDVAEDTLGERLDREVRGHAA